MPYERNAQKMNHKSVKSKKVFPSRIRNLFSYCINYNTIIIIIIIITVWNNIITDANKVECIQRKFEALCFSRSLLRIPCNYTYALELLTLHAVKHY